MEVTDNIYADGEFRVYFIQMEPDSPYNNYESCRKRIVFDDPAVKKIGIHNKIQTSGFRLLHRALFTSAMGADWIGIGSSSNLSASTGLNDLDDPITRKQATEKVFDSTQGVISSFFAATTDNRENGNVNEVAVFDSNTGSNLQLANGNIISRAVLSAQQVKTAQKALIIDYVFKFKNI